MPEDIPNLYIYPSDLAIMVGNLLDNAIKYTPDGGKISLTASWDTNTLEISIRDNGEGIPPATYRGSASAFFALIARTRAIFPAWGWGLRW